MNYQNWQKVHKQAYSSQRYKPVKNLTREEIRAEAWANLLRWCTTAELEKLAELAKRYQHGQLAS